MITKKKKVIVKFNINQMINNDLVLINRFFKLFNLGTYLVFTNYSNNAND